MSADVFIVSLGGLINHKNVQSDSSTPSWSQVAIEFTMVITIGNEPKPEYPWRKKTIFVGPSAYLRPLFNSIVT